MSNAADTRKPASFWRTISKEDALAARSAIETFFGAAQLQVQSPKEAAPVVHPQGARWVIGAGLALCAAAACTMLLRPLLPASIPDIRGLYIGLAGIVALAAGIAYWLIGTKRQDPPKPPVVVLEEEARTWIGKQVDHAEAYTMSLFGRAQAGAHRVQLQGIGKEWASAIGIRTHEEPDKNRTFASIVHLVAIDLAPPYLSIRQMGVNVMTMTTCEEWGMRKPLWEVVGVTRRQRNSTAVGEWDRAKQIVKELADLRKSGRRPARVTALERELKELSLEHATSHEFALAFSDGQPLTLTIADSEYAMNPSKIAYPVGGEENLQKAVATWEMIERACLEARAAREGHGGLASMGGTTAGPAGADEGPRKELAQQTERLAHADAGSALVSRDASRQVEPTKAPNGSAS